MKTYLTIIEKAPANYGAFSPDVPGCVSTGDTVEETLTSFREALQAHFEIMQEFGENLPEPQPIEAHIAAFRADGIELTETEFIWAFLPAENLLPEYQTV
jgi:predicted RNase H-like HicB family nuclease